MMTSNHHESLIEPKLKIQQRVCSKQTLARNKLLDSRSLSTMKVISLHITYLSLSTTLRTCETV